MVNFYKSYFCNKNLLKKNFFENKISDNEHSDRLQNPNNLYTHRGVISNKWEKNCSIIVTNKGLFFFLFFEIINDKICSVLVATVVLFFWFFLFKIEEKKWKAKKSVNHLKTSNIYLNNQKVI